MVRKGEGEGGEERGEGGEERWRGSGPGGEGEEVEKKGEVEGGLLFTLGNGLYREV